MFMYAYMLFYWYNVEKQEKEVGDYGGFPLKNDSELIQHAFYTIPLHET